jgi:Zn-dependent protease with chaperone function/RNA polymerase subunit RPABC4/transcription elongation factor Spt4
MTSPELHEFPGLSPAAFQHPLDVQAVERLRKVPLLPALIKIVSGSVFEKQVRLMHISSAIRLGPNQGRSVYEKFEKAAAILDLPELPDIYVSNQYVINAYAFGVKRYQITLFAGLIDMLTEDELLAVIGHELGHIKCQHMLYKTVAYMLRLFGIEFLKSLLPAGTGLLASLSLQLAILHWERMAELSCDRAALLVVQDREVVASALSKLAGGSRKILPEINLDEVLEQAQEYHDSDEGPVELLFKVNMMLNQTHPFPVVRAKEIMEWGDSDQYRSILNGEYVHTAASPALILSDPVGKVCSKCKQIANVSASVCLACGSSLKGARRVCANCRVKVFSTWTTCPGCGNDLRMPEKAATQE